MEPEAGEDQNKSLSPQQGRTAALRTHVVCDCSQTVSAQAQNGEWVPRTTELRTHVICGCSQTVSDQAQSGEEGSQDHGTQVVYGCP